MRALLAAASAVAAVALVPAAGAADEPFAFATARDGSFALTSSVILAPKRTIQQGGWVDQSRSCFSKRRLKVHVEVFFTPPSGPAVRRVKERMGDVQNCAEGGPNLGFTLFANRLGLACPNGRWKPGFYGYVTTTRDTVTGLRAIASLSVERTTPC